MKRGNTEKVWIKNKNQREHNMYETPKSNFDEICHDDSLYILNLRILTANEI